MSIREADRRRQELDQTRLRHDAIKAALQSEDWLERLVESSDYKQLVKRYQEAQAVNRSDLEAIKRDHFSQPMEPGKAQLMREKAMILEATIMATEDLIHFPQNQIKKLKDYRSSLPELEIKLRRMEEEAKHDHASAA